MLASTLREQIGLRALNVAESVAAVPLVRDAFQQQEPHKQIQPFAEMIRRKTGAEYVVVGNKEGIRYSHPLEERIGKKWLVGIMKRFFRGNPLFQKRLVHLDQRFAGKLRF